MKARVVVSLLTSAQEFQLMQAADARAAGQRTGLEVEVVFAENNAIQQIQQLYSFIRWRRWPAVTERGRRAA
jgi:hypothetical protein